MEVALAPVCVVDSPYISKLFKRQAKSVEWVKGPCRYLNVNDGFRHETRNHRRAYVVDAHGNISQSSFEQVGGGQRQERPLSPAHPLEYKVIELNASTSGRL